MVPISGGKTLPKEPIKTQKVTNAPHLISQSKSPASKEIIVNPKIQTDVSVLSTVTTGAIITPETRIQRKKTNIKSLAT